MSILGLLLLSLATVSHAQTYSSAQDLANALGFSGNPTSLSFPPESDAPLSNSKSSDYIIDNWSVEQNKIQFGANGLRFIQDPASSSNGSTSVLSVDYPAGSYSHKTGGTQFTVSVQVFVLCSKVATSNVHVSLSPGSRIRSLAQPRPQCYHTRSLFHPTSTTCSVESYQG